MPKARHEFTVARRPADAPSTLHSVAEVLALGYLRYRKRQAAQAVAASTSGQTGQIPDAFPTQASLALDQLATRPRS